MPDSDLALTTRDGDVALLTLNRPDKRNAFDVEMTKQFAESFRACRDAACIVITGTDPAFCSGADLRADADSLKNSGYPIGWQEIVDSPVPVIAAVNGPAVTGGFALAVNADFIIASERASFCDNELLVIGYGNAQLMAPLQRRVGDAAGCGAFTLDDDLLQNGGVIRGRGRRRLRRCRSALREGLRNRKNSCGCCADH